MSTLSNKFTSFWELGEASGTRVDAVVASANDLTDNNTVTQATGKVGNAAQFTLANSEYLSRASNSSLQTGDIDQTFCAWVYMDSTAAGMNMIILAKNDNAVFVDYSWFWRQSTNRFQFNIYGTGIALAASASADTFGAPSTATWYFVVAGFDSVNNQAFISVNNGAENTGAQAVAPITTSAAFTIGANAEPSAFWDGRIDQVGLAKALLTADEKTFLYNGGAGRSWAEIVTGPGGSSILRGPTKSGLIEGRLIG